jgi:hypothetical protein
MDEVEKKVRERAYKIWQEEGCPEGRAEVHWDKARELVAIEENLQLTLKPILTARELGPYGEPIEPLQPAENAAETLTLVDQGEEQPIPHARADHLT